MGIKGGAYARMLQVCCCKEMKLMVPQLLHCLKSTIICVCASEGAQRGVEGALSPRGVVFSHIPCIPHIPHCLYITLILLKKAGFKETTLK